MRRIIFTLSLLLTLLAMSVASGCVKQDPVDALVIQKVQEDLVANFDPGIMEQVEKWDMLKDNLKIYVVEDYPADKVKDLVKAAATAFGQLGRTNGKVAPYYYVQIYQTQENKSSGEKKQYNIAKGTFHNGKETVDIDMFGQGDGKYDY